MVEAGAARSCRRRASAPGRGGRLTIALLYLLGRMPEEDEKVYEIHLLECRSCLVRAEAVEQALRFHGYRQGEMRDMKDLRRKLFPLVVLFSVTAAPAPQEPK